MHRREFIRTLTAASLLSAAGCAHVADQTEAAKASALPKRPLGKTGVMVSTLAIGGVVGMQKPRTDDFDPVALAETALNMGITYFDTAPAYNKGQSESNYGEVIARRRNEVFLATKTGERSYDGAMRSVEASLKRLRTDRVDLLQVHGATVKDDLAKWGQPDGVLTALRKLRDQKVTRFLGVTGHDSAEVMRRALEMYEFDTILTTFNPTPRRQAYQQQVLPLALARKMGIVCMKVMGGGFGSLALGNPSKNTGTVYHDETKRQAAAATLIRYVLGLPISVAVVGMASVEQLKMNLQAARDLPPLNATERQQLEQSVA